MSGLGLASVKTRTDEKAYRTQYSGHGARYPLVIGQCAPTTSNYVSTALNDAFEIYETEGYTCVPSEHAGYTRSIGQVLTSTALRLQSSKGEGCMLQIQAVKPAYAFQETYMSSI